MERPPLCESANHDVDPLLNTHLPSTVLAAEALNNGLTTWMFLLKGRTIQHNVIDDDPCMKSACDWFPVQSTNTTLHPPAHFFSQPRQPARKAILRLLFAMVGSDIPGGLWTLTIYLVCCHLAFAGSSLVLQGVSCLHSRCCMLRFPLDPCITLMSDVAVLRSMCKTI